MKGSISGKRLAIAREMKKFTWQELADAFTEKATKEESRKVSFEVSAIQKWQNRGIPPKWLFFVSNFFKVDESIFTDKRLSVQEFKKIISEPTLIDTFRHVKEISASLSEPATPLPEIETSLPEIKSHSGLSPDYSEDPSTCNGAPKRDEKYLSDSTAFGVLPRIGHFSEHDSEFFFLLPDSNRTGNSHPIKIATNKDIIVETKLWGGQGKKTANVGFVKEKELDKKKSVSDSGIDERYEFNIEIRQNDIADSNANTYVQKNILKGVRQGTYRLFIGGTKHNFEINIYASVDKVDE